MTGPPDEVPLPLGELRVVDLSVGIAGGCATRMLADGGAHVVKVETPEGDPLRRWSASLGELDRRDGPLFQFLSASKQSVILDPSGPAADELFRDADLIVENGPPGSIETSGLLSRFPHLVVLSISPFGLTGPWADRPWSEFTLQAACGSTASRGWPDGTPVAAGGQLGEWAAGLYGATTALAAVRRARRTGHGAHVDLSMLECLTVVTNLFVDLAFSLMGRPPLPMPARLVEIPGLEPTADGWVCFYLASAQQFEDFCFLIDRPDLAADEQLHMLPGRLARRDEWNAAVRSWTARHTTAEVIEKASQLRIPVAPLCDGRSVLQQEQLVVREFFADAGDFRFPRAPFLVDGKRLPLPGPPPVLGEHGQGIHWPARPAHAPTSAPGEAALPLSGVKVLALTAWLAGPYAASILAALGAEVIHVESIQRPDGLRSIVPPGFRGRDRWWEWGSCWLSVATNKQAITVDLTRPEGLGLMEQLIPWSDVIIENFSPRVLENFGLGWDRIRELNDKAFLVRMPGFGLDGPWRDWPAMAPIAEALSGLTWVTGFPEAPLPPRGPSDFFGAIHAAFAALMALSAAETETAGSIIEVPLVECALRVAAEQVVEYTANGAILGRQGNRSANAAPQGLYACRGQEQWLALTIATDDQWATFKDILGNPPWSADPCLDRLGGRHAHHDELDAQITRWAGAQDLGEIVETLAAGGIPAAAVADPRSVHQNPQLLARQFFESHPHPVAGTHPIFTMPFRMSGVDRWIRSPAPTLGQHNCEVLGGILGLSEHDLTKLEECGIVGNVPSAYGLATAQVSVGYSDRSSKKGGEADED